TRSKRDWSSDVCSSDLPLHRGETDQITSIAEAIAFLDEHDLTEMRVVADLFHIMLEHEGFDVVRRHAGRVAHAHIADTDRRPPRSEARSVGKAKQADLG